MENAEKTQTDVLPRIMKALTTARTQLETLKQQAHEPIAIIGMACRFPGADSPEAYWELLANEEDRIAEIPNQRWDMDTYYDPVPATPGKSYVRTGAFVDGVDQFDPQFFGISPREAILLDPQQRLLLEVTWEALERAGQSPLALKNSQTGVFVGVGPSEYTTLMCVEEQFDAYSSTGNGALFAAGRLSYVLGLQGPNFAIDTACSASLIGVHQACESLRNGTSQLAIAGGVHLMLAPQGYIAMAQMQAMAPDGRSKTFDAAANGYGRGEGCGIVILKRLSAAQKDGDPILALIRGSATNHDGPSSGLTVPSANAQTKLIRAALAAGQVAANEVLYVEAHGTGTPLGDPIEIRALDAVFGQRANPLLIGSVKTNVGHLEEAAGVAGLIKVVLAMQHNQIPRHLHCHNPNPYIDWERTSIRVTTEPTMWPASKKIAGVSSFGMSGSNAHVILEQAPSVAIAPNQAERPYHLLTLSAKSEPALRELATRYGAFLAHQPTVALGDVCYTAYTGRSHFAHRLSVTAASSTQMAERLLAYANGVLEVGLNQSEGLNPQVAPKVAFLFTGQGSQYLNMGRELYESQPVFRAVLDRCEAVAQACLGRSLLELLYPATPPTHNDLLESHPCGQAANFAIECALADLWQSWGIQPDVVLGHSLGDFAAAYTAGVLMLEDGLRLVSARGRLMETARGSMLSVIASEADMLPFLKNMSDVTIGVINGPKSVVLSGGQHSVTALAAQLQQAGFKTRLLAIPVAAHSPLLDPVLADFEAIVRTMKLSAPKYAVISSMTGARVTTELTDPAYWRRHLRNTVRFADSIQTLQQLGVTLFLEIGPKPTLVGLAGQILDEMPAGQQDVPSDLPSPLMLPSLRDGYSDWQQMLESLGALYVRGLSIDWVAFDQAYQRHKVVLPTYAFQKQRYWVEPKAGLVDWLATTDAAMLATLPAHISATLNLSEADQQLVNQVLALLRREQSAQKLTAQPVAVDKTSLVQELTDLVGGKRLDHLRHYLQQTVSRILKSAELPARTTGFTELGMDSLMALELKKHLDRTLGLTLPATLAFEYPTIDALATYLLTDVLKLTKTAEDGVVDTRRLAYAMDEPIAVISMGCRFPGADTPDAFWQLLHDGTDRVGTVPVDRWSVDTYYAQQRPTPGKMYMREGAFIDKVDQFDPLFFGISPREAVGVDPQHRLLLEVSWEVLEQAGFAPEKLINSQTGVFVGIGAEEYGTLNNLSDLTAIDMHAVTNSGHSLAAGRIAYTFGLHGPTLAVDTACSSSLVAVHLACQSLRTGECDLALAGGVSLMLSPVGSVALSQMQALSPDGRCKTFDAAANGYGRGEGCGMILLQRLSDAVADGNQIIAVINGSAINHDGPSSGLTVPNRHAQEKVIQQALKNARLEPADISYVEAHGTGTPLGDPIELRALGQVFQERAAPLLIGSAKTNIGHLEAAAGIAGLIKVVLSLQHGEIPAHLHLQNPTSHIDWAKLPFQIPTASTPWPTDQRRAGVSSFGMSGTNCHVILSAAPAAPTVDTALTPNTVIENSTPTGQLLTLSARSPQALQELAGRYERYLTTHSATRLADICFTASTGRKHFTHRLAVVTQSTTQLRQQLAAFTQTQTTTSMVRTGVANTTPKRIVFLFTGQGAQFVGMGRELYATQPVFRAAIDRCNTLLKPYLDTSLIDILYPAAETSADQMARLDQTIYTQPALFALEYALAELWKSWGIEPDVVMGHSVGEYVAACVAGVFSLEEGLKLIAARGRLMQTLPSGGQMVSVKANAQTVAPFLQPYAEQVSIAAVNGPQATVISGAADTLHAICETLAAQGIQSKTLTVSHAFHSPLMQPIRAEFERIATEVKFTTPHITLISNLTGGAVTEEVTHPAYWSEHIMAPVSFAQGIVALQEQAVTHCIEIGPKAILLGMMRDCLAENSNMVLLPSIRPEQEWEQLFKSLSELYVQGMPIVWQGVYQATPDARPYQRLALPTYPFQRQRYWLDLSQREGHRPGCQNGATNGHVEPTELSSVIAPLAPEKFRQQVEGLSRAEQLARLLAYVRAEVAGLIGLSGPDQLDGEERLLDLGIDSLMAYELRSRLQSHLDCTLPSTLIFEHPTIADMVTYLAEIVLESTTPVLGATAATLPSTLVPIQPRGALPPLFMVAGILGSAFDFQQLAQHLDPAQPFYGLRSLGIDEDCPPFTQVAEIAAHHIRSLQAIQPTGPYHLGGYSFGGKIAYEMAQQLQGQGHTIALLTLLDTPLAILGDSQAAAAWDEAQFIVSLAELYAMFTEQEDAAPLAGTVASVRLLDSAAQLKFLQTCIKSAGVTLTELETHRALQVYKANLLAYSTYLPQGALDPTYALPITLIQAQERIAFDMLPTEAMTQQDPGWGWQTVSTAPFDLQIVPGDHITMVAKPHVARLAACLTSKLGQAQQFVTA